MFPKRYFGGLSPEMKKIREKELIQRRKTGKFVLGLSNSFAHVKKSQWTTLFHKVYPNLPFDRNLIAKKSGIPKKILNTVYDRGRRAWQTGGSRPGVTANQWGVARVYKFVLITKRKAKSPGADPNVNLRKKIPR